MIRVRATLTALALAVGTASIVGAQPLPADLSALAASARLDLPLTNWCRGEFQTEHTGAYAVAVTAAVGGGRYLVLESGATAVELAVFAGRPEISCYTPDAAQRLDLAISNSPTINGQITVPWTTTVVCGFVENTRATCWQYSPVATAFVKVGEWTT